MGITHKKYPLAIHLIINKNGLLLLSKRYNTGYEDGKYSLVAGHIEMGESIISAAVREAKEEIGISIKPEDIKIAGSMHRKSEDERIDFFSIVSKWEGVVCNQETNKCEHLLWCNMNELPPNIIPYIKRAIELTNKSNGSIWYEEYGWNTYSFLEGKRKQNLLNIRGISDNNNSYKLLKLSIVRKIKEFNNMTGATMTSMWIEHLKDYLLTDKIIIGTPILQNMNDNYDSSLSACTIITPPINRKGKILYKELAVAMERQLALGTGIGIDLSSVSEPEDAIKHIDSILYKIDLQLKKQQRRPVAAILTLNDSHTHIKDFIKCRNQKDFQQTRLNTSVFLKDCFREDIVDEIASSIYQCGEPGILFSTRLNEDNSTPQWKYVCTAPCAEIAMANNDACHFSYINLAGFVRLNKGRVFFDFDEFTNAISVITRFLDSIVEYSLEHSSEIKYELVNQKRRIGVGVAGFATTLIKLGIPYNSKEGLQFAKKIVDSLQFYSKKESVLLAKEKGAFKAFAGSKYSDEKWLQNKFSNNSINCNQLIKDIISYGIRNATTVAFPPTGMSSQLAGVSASFEPYLQFAGKYEGHVYIPYIIHEYIKNSYDSQESGELIAQLLRNEVDIKRFPEFVTATQVDVKTQLFYTRIFQDASDGSASKTIMLPEDTSKENIKKYIYMAEQMKLKGVSFLEKVVKMETMTKACVNISSKIVAIGPALTDWMFELDDNVYQKLLSRLNAKAGDWIEIQSIEEFYDLYSYVCDSYSNSRNDIHINGVLSAGSSLLGTLSAMPKKLRLQSSLVTSCATSKEELSLVSHSVFQKVVKQLSINYWGIKEKGFNAIGMIFSSSNIPDRLLAMYQGVSHHLNVNSNVIQAEYLLVSAFELTGGEITNSINELICSNKYKVILGLGNYLILSGNLLNMIKRYLKDGLIYCIAGNEAEFETMLHCNKPRTIRGYSLLENVPYILMTLGEKGMMGVFKDKEIFQEARHVNRIINTSGCGDISLGIFMSGIIDQMDPVLILRNAAYYSSIILQRSSNVFYEGIENTIE